LRELGLDLLQFPLDGGDGRGVGIAIGVPDTHHLATSAGRTDGPRAIAL
jgi:hypothetical protein